MSVRQAAPVLRLVPTSSIQFHEHPEHVRTMGLVKRLRREQTLRHPPIVAALPDERYLLLDGANRVSAFAELGHPQVPVQVIDYADPAVELKGWHHLLLEGRKLDLKGVYDAIPGVSLRAVAPEQVRAHLELRRAYALLVDPDGACWGLFPDPVDAVQLRPWVDVLQRVVAAYEGKTELERIKMADHDLSHTFDSLDHQLCLFPVFTKIELLDLARDGVLIPTGLTRHIVPGRALSLNLDLGFLQLSGDAERNKVFAGFLERLEVEGRIRLYEEAVFILNE